MEARLEERKAIEEQREQAPDGRADTPGALERASARFALRAAFWYALLGVSWIVASDLAAARLVSHPEQLVVQVAKGSAFVLGSAVVLYAFLRRFGRQRALAEARYRTLVERVPGVVYEVAADEAGPDVNRVLYMGPQIEDLLGYAPNEWADERLWTALVHPDDRDRFMEADQRSTSSGEPFSLEYRFVARDGRAVWVHDEAELVPADDRGPARWRGLLVDITAQKLQEQELQETGETLRAVFAASPLAIIILDRDGRVRYWNPAAERTLGWTADEVAGEPLPWVPPEALEEFHTLRRRVLSGEAFAGYETRRVTRDGRWIDVSISTAPLHGPDGEVEAIVGVVEDITERKRLAEEHAVHARQQEAVAALGLRALEGGPLPELLDRAMGTVADTLEVELVALLEPRAEDGRLLLSAGRGWRPGIVGAHVVDRGRSSLGGYALEVGEPVVVEDLAAERRFGVTPTLLEHGAASGAAVVVAGGSGPLGVLQAFSSTGRPFSRDDVVFLQTVGTLVGLAIERERAEAELRTAEARYRSLVEQGPGVVYIHDVSEAPAYFTYTSPQIELLLGYTQEEWMADPRFWLEVVHPEDRERLVRADTQAIRSGGPLDIEYRMIAKDGRQVWVHDQATLVRDADGKPLFRQGLIVDVTDRRLAEEERRRALESQLRLATRLEILHELDRDVLSATSVQELSGRALDRLKLVVPYDRASVVLFEGPAALRMLAVRPEEEVGPAAGSLVTVSPEMQRRVAERPVDRIDLRRLDPELGFLSWAAEAGFVEALGLSLVAEDEVFGALAVMARAPGRFGDEQVDVIREVASLLAMALHQHALRERLAERAHEFERLAGERQQLLHRIVRAQEEERERVALELHDGLGQVLTSISLFASDLADRVSEEVRPRADRVNELIRRAIVDSRQLVWSLRPPELDRLGLVPAVRRLAEDAAAHGDAAVDLHEEIGDLRLAPESEAVVYRVVQEALHNAQKHAQASTISVVLSRHHGLLSALVEDNGRGFDVETMPDGRGLGLLGMRERAELVGGTLVVESGAGRGTRVRLEVPIAVGERGAG